MAHGQLDIIYYSNRIKARLTQFIHVKCLSTSDVQVKREEGK